MSLILFDFDGVLADTLDDLLRFGQEVCDELGVGHHVIKEDLSILEVMSFSTFGRQLEIPEPLNGEFVRRCLDKVAGKEFPPDIFAGLAEIVRELSARNTLAIVTTNSAQNVKAFLRTHRLEEVFDAIYGVELPGSKAEKISQARSQFAAAGEAVFMIGDSVSDIRAAKQAEVQSVAVGWGHQSLAKLIKEKPDHVAGTVEELSKLFEAAS